MQCEAARAKEPRVAALPVPAPCRPHPSAECHTVGCLPLPLFFLLGVGLGYAVDGKHGALWGAGIGLVLGLAGMGTLVVLLRRGR